MNRLAVAGQLIDICDEIALRCIVDVLKIKELSQEDDKERARIVEILLNHFCAPVLTTCRSVSEVVKIMSPGRSMTEKIVKECLKIVADRTITLSLRALTRQAKPLIEFFLEHPEFMW